MAKAQIEQLTGVSVSEMLRVIDGPNPAGTDLRGDTLFSEIEDARSFEDPGLPMGPWERDLEKADWPRVLQLTGKSIAGQSKDLQLAVWFVEAATHNLGFAAVEPCFDLLHQMCTGFWETMYPEPDEGEEFRVNLLSWFNRGYVVQLNRLAVTDCGEMERLSRWDWLVAQRNVRLAQRVGEDELEGCTVDRFAAAIGHSSTEFLLHQFDMLTTARESIVRFSLVIDELLKDRSPSFAELLECLDDILQFTESELAGRPLPVIDEASPQSVEAAAAPMAGAPGPATGSREEAYARLAEIAEYLLRADPHSPAPYLIRKAIEWSRLSTADLYRDLFVKHQGEIHIFDLLGITASSGADPNEGGDG